ncbi:hypothetical protein EDC94DRAFT_535908 [Helicostylum pulchrum]|nr:hypothetical protein EDC94DRAFT_535908 [Helicostylum pulchrum]
MLKKSNTKDPMTAKIKSVNLQIYKLKKKLLCEKVFASINTSANDPILSRDYNKFPRSSRSLAGCIGDSQTMIDFITETNRKVRLVVIDFAGLSTNVDDLRHFIKNNRSISEVSVDESHKVNVYTRYELLHGDDIISKFNCRQGPVTLCKEILK